MQAGEGESESDTMVRPGGPRSSPYGAHRSIGGVSNGRSKRVLLLVGCLIVVGLFGELVQNVHVVQDIPVLYLVTGTISGDHIK